MGSVGIRIFIFLTFSLLQSTFSQDANFISGAKASGRWKRPTHPNNFAPSGNLDIVFGGMKSFSAPIIPVEKPLATSFVHTSESIPMEESNGKVAREAVEEGHQSSPGAFPISQDQTKESTDEAVEKSGSDGVILVSPPTADLSSLKHTPLSSHAKSTAPRGASSVEAPSFEPAAPSILPKDDASIASLNNLGSTGRKSGGKSSGASSSKISPETSHAMSYIPPPPLVRREIEMEPRCSYDTNKWALHPETAITHAVMFERSTGGSCEECLKKCERKQHGTWTCRSLTFDTVWKICDLFAIKGSGAPFYLVDYSGRDYFEYIAAMPPTDAELNAVSDLESKSKDSTSIVTCEQKIAKILAKIEKDKDAHSKVVHGVKTHGDVTFSQENNGGQGNTYGAVSIKDQLYKNGEKELALNLARAISEAEEAILNEKSELENELNRIITSTVGIDADTLRKKKEKKRRRTTAPTSATTTPATTTSTSSTTTSTASREFSSTEEIMETTSEIPELTPEIVLSSSTSNEMTESTTEDLLHFAFDPINDFEWSTDDGMFEMTSTPDEKESTYSTTPTTVSIPTTPEIDESSQKNEEKAVITKKRKGKKLVYAIPQPQFLEFNWPWEDPENPLENHEMWDSSESEPVTHSDDDDLHQASSRILKTAKVSPTNTFNDNIVEVIRRKFEDILPDDVSLVDEANHDVDGAEEGESNDEKTVVDFDDGSPTNTIEYMNDPLAVIPQPTLMETDSDEILDIDRPSSYSSQTDSKKVNGKPNDELSDENPLPEADDIQKLRKGLSDNQLVKGLKAADKFNERAHSMFEDILITETTTSEPTERTTAHENSVPQYLPRKRKSKVQGKLHVQEKETTKIRHRKQSTVVSKGLKLRGENRTGGVTTAPIFKKMRKSKGRKVVSLAKSQTHRVGSGYRLCQDGESVVYMRFEKTDRPNTGKETQTVDGIRTVDDCMRTCDEEGLFACSSAVLSKNGCEMSTTLADHGFERSLIPSLTHTYIEKMCIPSWMVDSRVQVMYGVPNYILVGHVEEVEDASTLQECVTKCLHARKRRGYNCMSAMWYAKERTQNCLMNSESRLTRPQVFSAEDDDSPMVYFEMKNVFAKEKPLDVFRLRDQPIPSKWTFWSTCEGSEDKMRFRYEKCAEKNIRKCPKEMVSCRVSTNVSDTSPSPLLRLRN